MNSANQNTKIYDYIICGGGTSGCVIAGRLAEKTNSSILILEAGKPREFVPASAIPAGVSKILGTEADWNIQSEPCAQLNNRKLHLGRGKFIGGSSGCNGTLCIRGIPQDYDGWNLDGWSGKEMFKYMRKAEKFENKDWFKAHATEHGAAGPLVTAPHDPAPISNLVLESFQSKGIPFDPDMFTTGKTAQGCGHVVRSIYQGMRTCSSDYLPLGPSSAIETLTEQYVDKILFERTDEGKFHASSVETRTSDGTSSIFKAAKDVILTAGTYGSPAILLRSGVGPSEEIKDFGIETILELPGVGKNLMDHLVMHSFYEVSKPDLTNDHLIWHPGGQEKSAQQYKDSKTGFFSQFPFGCFAFARLDERLQDSDIWKQANENRKDSRDAMGALKSQPYVEFWNTECYSPKYMFKDFPPPGKYAFALATTFFSQRSRGEVKLASKDPLANPKVQHDYLNDPLDMLMFSEGCRLANEIALEGAGTKDIIVGSWPAVHGHEKFTSREQWVEAIRQRADTCYHPAGSCKMGKTDDQMAVVDEKLHVKGVTGLRVADASIIPTLMSGHPQMAVFAIGEKAADLILGV